MLSINQKLQVFILQNTTTASQGKSGNSSRMTIVAIVVPISVAVLILVVGMRCLRKRIRNKHDDPENELSIDMSNLDSHQYDFHTIEAATNNFSVDNKVGRGGFGTVYKGMLPDGQKIAAKRLFSPKTRDMLPDGQEIADFYSKTRFHRSRQHYVETFRNEVEIQANLKHKNIVKLLGSSVQDEEKILVFEYMPYNLNDILFSPGKQKQLDWAKRYKIIKGIVQGIQYIHNDSRLRFIHRNLKPINILLDSNMNPKISDFGLALFFTFDQTQGNTGSIVGTFGYMAPEYMMHGDFSVKSDVYSFGIILMEIISRRCIPADEDDETLISRAWRLWKKAEAMEILDPTIRESSNPSEVMRCIHIALLCVQQDPEDRPSMSSVVIMLQNYSMTLPTPSRPAFCKPSDDSRPTSENEMSDSEVIPR